MTQANMPCPHPHLPVCRRPKFRSSGLLQSQSVQSGALTRWAGSCVPVVHNTAPVSQSVSAAQLGRRLTIASARTGLQMWPQYFACGCVGVCRSDCPCTRDANFCEKVGLSLVFTALNT